MRKILGLVILFITTITLVGCSEVWEGDGLKVVSSFTIITDMVEQIGQDKVQTYNVIPSGKDPHEHELTSKDIKKTTDADLLLYNGMNLEGGDNGWINRLISTTKITNDKVFNLSKNMREEYIDDLENDNPKEVNPHTFVSPKNGIIMAENILSALIEIDSDNEEFYIENANEYLNLLKEIDNEYDEKFNSVPKERRILVTSERAFQYLTKDYDILEGFIWAIDTEENGTPEQIKNLVEFIKNNDVNYLFLESNVDKRPMETVSKETGVDIYEENVYADEIGNKGTIVDTYEKFLRHNLRVFYKGLTS